MRPHSDHSVAGAHASTIAPAFQKQRLLLLTWMSSRSQQKDRTFSNTCGARFPPREQGRLLQPEASMATKQSRSKTGRTSVPDIDVRDHLTKRFKLWLMANGDDARTEALHQLLARTYRSGKRKVPRTKTWVRICSLRKNRHRAPKVTCVKGAARLGIFP
jgi:hypothetical protein